MKRLRGLLLLMGLVILLLTAFQAYWLRDNYSREKKALHIRANGLFRETVREMQDSILQSRLQQAMKDSSQQRPFEHRLETGMIKVARPLPRTARVINLLSRRAADSMRTQKGKKGVFITVKGDTRFRSIDSTRASFELMDSLKTSDIKEMVVINPGRKARRDSMMEFGRTAPLQRTGVMELSQTVRSGSDTDKVAQINTLYFNDETGNRIVIRVDSLYSDSLPQVLLNNRIAAEFEAEKIDVPFTVKYVPEKAKTFDDENIHARFTEREPYKLELGNSFPFLVKKISLPIVFSVFLVGITLLSFVLLYRNLVRQHRLSVMKNDLISNISHELKTPIATVGVALEALKNFNAIDDAERTREYLDISQNEIQRLNLLVDKVLKLSIFEKKEIELKKEWFDCRALAEEIINSMRLQFEKYHAVVSLDSEGTNFAVEADKLHISSVLYNLLDNALKYSKDQPQISVKLVSKEQHLEITVADNGIGIPQEYKRKVFDKFFRVPNGDRHDAKGYGLGLSYVAEVLKRHQGFITVDSELEKGSTFTVHLPYQGAKVIDFGNGRIIKKEL